MSLARWAVSVFLVWHLVAIGIGSLPAPSELPSVSELRHPTDDPVAARLTPLLDAAVRAFSPVSTALWNAAAPIRPMTDFYLGALRLAQRWNMFWKPPQRDVYLRVRYYVGSDLGHAPSPSRMATELVLPVHREDTIRPFHSYRIKHRERAIATALDRFLAHRDRSLVRADTRSSELPDDLAPVLAYFSRAFQRDHVGENERILRSEVWDGTVLVPQRGLTIASRTPAGRLAVLRAYYAGPLEQRVRIPVYPSYYEVEREGDIEWVLEYFQGH